MNSNELAHILQVSLSPVILISGVGLLLLSMTNRLGRVVDRSRQLAKEFSAPAGSEVAAGTRAVQIRILYRRARLLTASIAFAAASILGAALLVVSLFVGYALGINTALLAEAVLILGLVSLVVSLCLFLRDVGLSLHALKLEIAEHIG